MVLSIDGGAAKLRLELIIDTSKKPLAARIVQMQRLPLLKPW